LYGGWPRRERWLAELVLRLVEEREEKLRAKYPNSHPAQALHDFDITPDQFAEIKRRLVK